MAELHGNNLANVVTLSLVLKRLCRDSQLENR